MPNVPLKVLALSLTLIGTTALPAGAQMGPGIGGPGMGPGMMQGYGHGYGMGGWRGQGGWHMWGGGPDAMESRIDGRLAFLKAELKITEQQTPAWNKVAEAVRASTENMRARMKQMFDGDQESLALPERIELHEQFMTARLDEIKTVKLALNDLYEVLSAEQKKEADTLVLPMVGMGMMMGGRGPGAGMGPGMRNR